MSAGRYGFSPTAGGTLTFLGSSGGATRQAIPGLGPNILVTNGTGANPIDGSVAFIRMGDVTVAATVNDLPIQRGGKIMLARDPTSQTYASVIMAGTSGTVYVTAGDGGIL